MTPISIAALLLAQWKGYDVPAPMHRQTASSTTGLSGLFKQDGLTNEGLSTALPPGVEPSIGYESRERREGKVTRVAPLSGKPAEREHRTFVPSKLPVDQETTNRLRIRLVSCVERRQKLTMAINRNAGQFYASASPGFGRDNCTPSRQQIMPPRIQPESQAARYLAHNHKLQFQLRAVSTEIVQIEQELLRRGEDV